MKKKIKRNKKSNFLESYTDCWRFIKKSRNYIYVAVILFFAISVIGFIFPIFFREQIIDYIKSLSTQLDNYDVYQLVFYIFFNNLKSAFLSLILGIFFGIVPVINAVVNGYLLGFVARAAVDERGLTTLWKLFPHGIFELPAVFISIGLGLRLGTDFFRRDPRKNLKKDFIDASRVFLLIVIPLLLVAAIIEGILFFFLR